MHVIDVWGQACYKLILFLYLLTAADETRSISLDSQNGHLTVTDSGLVLSPLPPTTPNLPKATDFDQQHWWHLEEVSESKDSSLASYDPLRGEVCGKFAAVTLNCTHNWSTLAYTCPYLDMLKYTEELCHSGQKIRSWKKAAILTNSIIYTQTFSIPFRNLGHSGLRC